MSNASASAAEMLTQLESARKLALGDAAVYTQVIPGILPIIGPTAPLEVRRWGVEFLAEGFASPLLQTSLKEQLVSDVLPTLKTMLDNANEDASVVKCAIQASASVYPLVFSRVISHPDQALLWRDMTAMKLNILGRMDNAPTSVKICCIKFLQKVVQVQTPGLIADPRRPERNEVSLALVPRNHPLLPLQNLEAETSGLLDRLLSTLQEQSSDPIMVDATMNCLAVLIRTRPAVANKILSIVLNYNPFKTAATGMTPRQVVVIKSLERTTRALLRHFLRVAQNHPMQQKVDTYLQRLAQTRIAVFSEPHSLKRPAEPTDGADDAKRQRLIQAPRRFPPMPPPPNSFAQLFTLTQDTVLQQFDVKLLPADMVSNIAILLLQHIDSQSLDEAVEAVRQRYVHIQKVSQPTPVPEIPLEGPTGIDDEDDYDPEGFAPSSTSSVLNESIVSPATEKALEELAQPVIELGPFELPKPPPLSIAEIAVLSDNTFNSVFDTAKQLERNPSSQATRQKSGLNRLAASSNDSQAWITLLCRIATRAPAGLDELVDHEIRNEDEDENLPSAKKEYSTDLSADTEKPTMSNQIRHALFTYILEDWRARLNIAITWLTEEWYADKVASRYSTQSLDPATRQRSQSLDANDDNASLPNYTRTMSRLLTHLIPRIDASDSKLLIRFLSESPHLSPMILDQIKQLAFDPVTMKICILSLQYLVMFRPPVRTMVLDCLESTWREAGGDDGSGVRIEVAKVLKRWRPGFVEQAQTQLQSQVNTQAQAQAQVKTSRPSSTQPKNEEGKLSVGGPMNGMNSGGEMVDSPANESTVPPATATVSLDPRRRG